MRRICYPLTFSLYALAHDRLRTLVEESGRQGNRMKAQNPTRTTPGEKIIASKGAPGGRSSILPPVKYAKMHNRRMGLPFLSPSATAPPRIPLSLTRCCIPFSSLFTFPSKSSPRSFSLSVEPCERKDAKATLHPLIGKIFSKTAIDATKGSQRISGHNIGVL